MTFIQKVNVGSWLAQAVTSPNKAIKNRAHRALDSQQVARLLWRRYT